MGRDVDAIVRDLVAAAVDMVRREKQAEVREKATARVEERLLDLLLPPPRPAAGETPEAHNAQREQQLATREKLRAQLRAGQLDARTVEVEVPERTVPTFQILGSQGAEEMDVAIRDMLPGLFGQPHEAADAPAARGARGPAPGGGGPPRGPGPGGAGGGRAGGVVGDRVPRRDRQDRGPGERPRPGRLARGRPARPPADRRGHDRLHEVRPGAHRPRPLHRRRGLPREQAHRPHPRAAGPLPDPGGAPVPRRGGPPADPHRAAERARPASTATSSGPRASRSSSPTTRSRRWPASPPASTTPPRTSGPGASPRSSRRCSTRSPSRPGGTSPFAVTVDAAYVRRRLEPLVKSQDLSRFIL